MSDAGREAEAAISEAWEQAIEEAFVGWQQDTGVHLDPIEEQIARDACRYAFTIGSEWGQAAERERAIRECTRPDVCTCACGIPARAESAEREGEG